MKRIVDGKTYNTATSTVVAETNFAMDDQQRGNVEVTLTLYETTGGEFFLIREERWPNPNYDRHSLDDPPREKHRTELYPQSLDEARATLNEGDWEVFAELPDKAPKNREDETVLVRLPPSLKARVETMAKNAGQSLNEFALRCFERCIQSTDQPKAKKPKAKKRKAA